MLPAEQQAPQANLDAKNAAVDVLNTADSAIVVAHYQWSTPLDMGLCHWVKWHPEEVLLRTLAPGETAAAQG
jgi:hypothetical protein